MKLTDMIDKYPEQYICICNSHLDKDNLVTNAVVLKVYETLQKAYESKAEIKRFMNNYPDFDIIYGDIDDYISTRKGKLRGPIINKGPNEKCTQAEIDMLIKSL